MDNEKMIKEVMVDFKIVYNAMNFYIDSMNETEFQNIEDEEIKELYSSYEKFNERLEHIKTVFGE